METWKPVPGFEALYECSDIGGVRNTAKRQGTRMHKPLKPYPNLDGHMQVALRKDGRYHRCYVHRLVMAAFRGPGDFEVNHLNGNKADNRLANLEYTTTQKNLLHACRVLGVRSGEKHWNARLSNTDVLEIHALREAGLTQQAIADRYGVTRAYVSEILSGHARRITELRDVL